MSELWIYRNRRNGKGDEIMDIKVQIEVIAIVGILSGLAMYMGLSEMATAGLGGLVGFLSANQLKEASE